MTKPIKERLPSTEEILKQALERLLEKYKVSSESELKDKLDASTLIVELEREADKIYREEERKAVRDYLIDKGLSSQEADKVIDLIFYERDLTKEISNIRRARAGRTAESILMKALGMHGIKCEKGRVKEGYRPDIVIPSNERVIIAIAVKRTLRERWAEDVDVFKFKHGMFVLITPDPDFSEGKARDMVERGMREIYIPDELYYKSGMFIDNYPQFKKLSELPSKIKKILEAL